MAEQAREVTYSTYMMPSASCDVPEGAPDYDATGRLHELAAAQACRHPLAARPHLRMPYSSSAKPSPLPSLQRGQGGRHERSAGQPGMRTAGTLPPSHQTKFQAIGRTTCLSLLSPLRGTQTCVS